MDGRFTGVYEFEEGKITSFHLYFDQAELFTQLGIAAGSMPSCQPAAGLAHRTPACQPRREPREPGPGREPPLGP